MKRTWMMMALLLSMLSSTAAAQQPVRRFGLWPVQGNGPLRLVRHDVQVDVRHPLAEITLTQEFDNPTSSSLEAYYYYPVPAGATVTGLALWVNGERREARMLERQRAREIYSGIVNQRRDPALVERMDGNLFRIRIFPVLPRQRQRVELRFAQPLELRGRDGYRLVLRRPPGELVDVLRLGLRLQAPFSLAHVELHGHDTQLSSTPQAGTYALAMPARARPFMRDIELRYRARQPPRGPLATSHSHDGRRLFVAEVNLPERTAGAERRLVLLVDRSRSMQAHRPAVTALVREIVSRLRPIDRALVIPFDVLSMPGLALQRGDAAGQQTMLAALQLDSRLGTAFDPAFEEALRHRPNHIVCITDGGDRMHQQDLEQVLRRLHDDGATPVSTVLVGAAEHEALRERARRTSGVHLARRSAAGDASRVLAFETPRRVRLSPGGAVLQPIGGEGQRRLLTGSVTEAAAAATGGLALQLAAADQPFATLHLTPGPQQHRATAAVWASQAIDARMTRIKLFGEEPPLVAEIIALSQTHNVVSEYTALLATETDADYQRPTSGRRWQRRTPAADDLPDPSFHATPEPHEYALMALALAMLYAARRRGWLPRRGSTRAH